MPIVAHHASDPSTITERLDLDLLRDIAAGVARASTLWRPLVKHHPAGREPVRLLATDAYEVWGIGWSPGQRAELHDHGEAVGHLLVVEGVLTEHEVEHHEDGVRRLRRTDLPAGTARSLEAGVVHEIGNHDSELATSIHVYSPPLRTMTHYDPVSLLPTVTELVPPDAPAIEVAASSVLNHPSLRG